MSRYVLHVDLDEFVVAVQRRSRPELAGQPVVVGAHGDPTARGVVSSASYEARRFGVRSGMALRTARRRCPDAVFLALDVPACLAASETVMDTLRESSAVVEVAGWDEAFLEVDSDDPEGLARDLQRRVRAQTGLWCSVGIGENKLHAKVGSGLAKPAGVVRVSAARWQELVGSRSTETLPGVGPKRARALAALGIHTVAQLGDADSTVLASSFGPRLGPSLRRLGRGEDDTPVVAEPPIVRSHGHETTFPRDVDDPDAARAAIVELARRVAEEVRKDHRSAARVVVKIRFAPFRTHSRGVALTAPTDDPETIVAAARDACERFELDRPVRLVGVRVDLATGATGSEARISPSVSTSAIASNGS